VSPFDAISRFRGCPVLVVGDLMLDEFVWGTVTRISPEAPVPVVEVQKRTDVAGGAANAAANVTSLGGRAILAGLIGDDAAGARMRKLLTSAGIDTAPVIAAADRPTTTKMRIVAHSQQVVRLDHEVSQPLPGWLEMDLLQQIDRVLPRVAGCILSDYGKGVVTPTFAEQLIGRCRSAGVPIIVDPKGTDYAKYRGATVVKPNQLEAGRVLNRELKSDESVREAGRDLLSFFGSDGAVLITRGAHGMTLFERSKEPLHLPAAAREVFDVTGAGDTVAATMTLALAAGTELPEACRLAGLAAGIVVGKAGTATVTAAELMAALGDGVRRQAA
jgi:D-beta-D-heptose 7-phosphate kinase/D-beta-D-heptose 1-phosphate adenosyltransferase